LLDTGVIGFLAFLWLSITFVSRGFRNWRKIANDRMKGIVLGFTLAYLTVLIAAIANSTFTQWSWTPVIGIMMGVNEIVIKENWNG
jgi:O-antigen ligase